MTIPNLKLVKPVNYTGFDPKDVKLTLSVLEDVLDERARQDRLKGTKRDLSLFVWNALLAEESGEVAQAIVDLYSYTPGVKKDKTPTLIDELRTELLQTAAVAVAIVEAIDEERIKFAIPSFELPERE